MVQKLNLHSVLLVVLAFVGVACGSSPTEPEPFDIETAEFADELEVDPGALTETESGAYYEDRVVGEGNEVVDGATVEAWHFILWLPDGTEIQDSRDFTNPPSPITIGAGQVFAGFEEALVGMLEGGTRLVILPPDLAYGEEGNGPIPPNSAIVFEVVVSEVTPPPAE